MSRREGAGGKRCIGKPTNIRCIADAVQSATAKEAVIQQKPSKRSQPEAECVQAREGHIAGTDLKRDDKVRESEQKGHSHEKDHRGPMHGEEAVVDLRAKKMIVGDGQLNAYKDGFGASDQQEEDRVEDIEDAEALVVDSSHPPMQPFQERSCRCA